MLETNLIDYYRRRAAEYERIFARPERQADLARLRSFLAAEFRSHHVLEISCGTGRWTEAIAPVACSVTACDINDEVLEIARAKDWGGAPVEFRAADSFALPDFGRRHSAAFAGFWWSHVPRRNLAGFLSGLHAHVAPGAKVLFIDNRYIEGSSTPISRTDDAGDSFQQRRLEDGSVHEVLKNFPSPDELLQAVAGCATSPEVSLTDYFWALRYEAR
ncbi:MAG TPA: class I SAM-dependent methyltransferase [Opitutus sp.]|nr:class I SAM-dependent methyltransferase [Opitutus sp.]